MLERVPEPGINQYLCASQCYYGPSSRQQGAQHRLGIVLMMWKQSEIDAGGSGSKLERAAQQSRAPDQRVKQDSVHFWLVLNCIQVSRRSRRQSRGDYKCLGHASNEQEPWGRLGEHPHASRPGLEAVQYSKNMHVVKVDRIWCILIGSW